MATCSIMKPVLKIFKFMYMYMYTVRVVRDKEGYRQGRRRWRGCQYMEQLQEKHREVLK